MFYLHRAKRKIGTSQINAKKNSMPTKRIKWKKRLAWKRSFKIKMHNVNVYSRIRLVVLSGMCHRFDMYNTVEPISEQESFLSGQKNHPCNVFAIYFLFFALIIHHTRENASLH